MLNLPGAGALSAPQGNTRVLSTAASSGLLKSHRGEKQQIGHFSILEKLGQGSFGTVFKARDINNGEIVVMKVITLND